MPPHSALPAPRSVLAVDWSGARTSAHSKIWLAEARDGRLASLEGDLDRVQVIEHLIESAAREPRLIAGLDFAFSLPAWFLRERGLSAFELWELVAREGEDWLRACPAPFWGLAGCPRPDLGSGRSFFRRTDQAAPSVAGIRPKSVFQIGGAGAVGTGSLRGMPHLATLRRAGFAIWPFDPPRLPMIIEIYPRLLTGPVNKSQREARARYLGARLADQAPVLRERAAATEDAFDAAVSAWRMARHTDALRNLPADLDDIDRLEGRIWPESLA